MSFSVSFSKGQLSYSAAGPHLLWLFLVAFMSLTRISLRWALAFQIPSLNNRAMSFCSFCATSPCLDLFYAPFLYLRLIRIFLFIHSGLLSPFMSSFISEWALLEIGGGDPGKSVRSTSAVEENQWEAPRRRKKPVSTEQQAAAVMNTIQLPGPPAASLQELGWTECILQQE